MYRSDLVAERIKYIAKIRKVPTIKEMLEKCGLSKNALSTMYSGGSMPKSDNLAKLADYLECSVDYLLGRSDTPNMSNSVDNSVLINGSINNSNHSTLNVATPPQDEMTQQLIDGFKTLSFENKLKIMNTLFELKKES